MLNGYYINDYINSPESNSSSARTLLNGWLNTKLTSEEQELLKNEQWCIGDLTNAYSYDDTGEIVGNIDDLIVSRSNFEYTAGNKYYVTKTPSYICETTGKNGEIDINKVGMLTFDEIVYAGGGDSSNSNYYLNNNAKAYWWWMLSPDFFDYVEGNVATSQIFYLEGDGSILDYNVFHNAASLRASVSIKSDVIVSDGVGTISDPYVIG